MNSRLLSLAVVTALSLAVVGCASGPKINPNITVFTQETVGERPVELPGNYNTDNFRRMTLATMPGTLLSNAFSADNMQYMSIRLQSELGKIRRFSIAPIHGVDTSALEELADFGEIELPEPVDPTRVDLLASWNTNINAEEQVDGREKTITFVCTINLTCKEMATGKLKFSKDLDFRVKRTQEVNRAGTVVAGFQYREKADVQGLLQEIATQSAIRIANEIGNEYPVGGKITGMLGTDFMTVDKGTEQGIDKDMQMVIFARVGGVDIPLANASATPSGNSSQLAIWRLNTDNKYAEKVLKQMQEDPSWLQKNQAYAVGYGMAMPPEWQTKSLYIPE